MNKDALIWFVVDMMLTAVNFYLARINVEAGNKKTSYFNYGVAGVIFLTGIWQLTRL